MRDLLAQMSDLSCVFAELDKRIESDPRDVAALVTLASLLMTQGKLDQALTSNL